MPDDTINLTVLPASSTPELAVSVSEIDLNVSASPALEVNVETPTTLNLGVVVPDSLNLNIASNQAAAAITQLTGEVVALGPGSAVAELAAPAITNKTTVTAASNDFVLISDTSDSGNLKKALASDFGGGGSGSGTVTSVSVTTANGVSGTVATATTTPAITIALGDITPTSVVASGNVSGANLSGNNSGDQTSIVGITGSLAEFNAALTGADFATGGGVISGTSSGTNTGDQTSVSGNAGTATALATGRTISVSTDATGTSGSFDGTGNVTIPVTLATVNSNVGTFGSATKSVVLTANGKGLLTAASESTITPAVGSITGLGTGVATALAVNTGTSGSFVVNSTTVNGHALTSNVTVTASDVSLGNVTNDAQTKAAIVPNTVPSAGQMLVGNAGGTAYAPVSSSGDVTISSAGVMTIGANKVTGAMIALGSDVRGDIMYYNGTDWARLGAGTSGLYLKTLGAGSDPTWDTPTGSGDMPVKAWVNFDGTSAANLACTYSRSGTTVTVTSTSHGHLVGHVVYIDFTSGGALDGVYTIVSVPDANSYTVTTAASGTIAGGSTMNENRRTIRASSGVHSVTYAATGTYYINFTTALSDANYTIIGTSAEGAGTAAFNLFRGPTNTPTAQSFQCKTSDLTALKDPLYISVQVAR